MSAIGSKSSDLPLVIVNPASAGGATGKDWPALAVRIRDNFGPFTVAFTKKPGDAKRIAAEATRNKCKLILACGGDGTLSEAANGIMSANHADETDRLARLARLALVKPPMPTEQWLAKSWSTEALVAKALPANSELTESLANVELASSTTELGLLPHGTGGDFRKTLALPARFADAARALAQGITRRIDIGEVNYFNLHGQQETRYFINVASFGMGGEVARRANDSNKTFGGTAAFAYATLTTTLSYQTPEIWLQVDQDAPQRQRISNVTIANGRFFGGGMQIAPDAKLDDGLFDLILVGDIKPREIIANAYRLYRGTHLGLDFVNNTRAATITAYPVNEREIIRIEIDGEAPGRLPARFRLHARALAIRCPQRS